MELHCLLPTCFSRSQLANRAVRGGQPIEFPSINPITMEEADAQAEQDPPFEDVEDQDAESIEADD